MEPDSKRCHARDDPEQSPGPTKQSPNLRRMDGIPPETGRDGSPSVSH